MRRARPPARLDRARPSRDAGDQPAMRLLLGNSGESQQGFAWRVDPVPRGGVSAVSQGGVFAIKPASARGCKAEPGRNPVFASDPIARPQSRRRSQAIDSEDFSTDGHYTVRLLTEYSDARHGVFWSRFVT
jgi:hypothetical protein